MSIDKMCRNKTRYQSRTAARFFAITDLMRPYPCPHCKGWHLTSDIRTYFRHPRRGKAA